MNRLRELRIEKGWSQKELAEIVNISINNIQKWEQEVNDLSKAEFNSVDEIADTFGVSTKYLVGKNDERKNR